MVTLHSNTPVPSYLPLLKFGMEVVFNEQVEDLLLFALDLKNGVKTLTFELHFYLGGRYASLQVPNLTIRASSEAILCYLWNESYE